MARMTPPSGADLTESDNGVMSWDDEKATFVVVINHEGQYSIWPDYLKIPRGWTATGKQGNKQECLEYVDTHWTDMRPASLRRASGV